MSSEALKTAYRAERDLNTSQAKQGTGQKSDSTRESGVDEMVDKRFGQETSVREGTNTSGSDHKPIPEEEGGKLDDRGRLSKAGEFEGKGGPEDKVKMDSARRPGDDDTMNLQEMKQKGIDRTA
ncbi:hypothetical protein PHISP_05546 [Aspergillus sp. HF37]|nr:hypothetical protein PHISP_05546 [Aspergillus sp. HF37]